MKYLTTAILFTSVIQAYPWLQTQANGTSNSAWNVDQFKNFIVFGDSYSDENRLDYFLDHNYTAPPTGTLLPESLHAADGGRVWARYVVQYTNELTLYNYAVDGGSCSSEITPFVYKPGVGLYPDLDGYEVPAFLADKAQDVNIATGGPYFNPPLDYENTVYAIFDGTNDISIGSFFTDSQAPGATLSDFVGCLYTQVDRLYASGGRYFVLFNIMPLELTALFGNATEGGETPSVFWPDKPSNLTDIAEKMKEWTTTLNTLFKYRTPVEVLLNHRYPGAKFALFDVNSLVLDIHNNPSTYLNGTAPPQPTGYSHHCPDASEQVNCTDSPSPDSFAWYDPSHPSEQVSRIIAKNFVDLLGGNSEYATYYEC